MDNFFKISNEDGINKWRPWTIHALIAGFIVFVFSGLYFYRVFNLPTTISLSSTDGLKYPFAFAFCLKFAFCGALLGIIIGKIIDLVLSIFTKSYIKTTATSVLLSVFLIFIASNIYSLFFNQARLDQEVENMKNANGIKYNTGAIEKIPITVSNLKNYNIDLNKNHTIAYWEDEGFPRQKEFNWNNKKYTIIHDGRTHILVKNADGSTFISHSTDDYNYIDTSSFIISSNDKGSYLFVLSRLRPTSHQALLNVFSEDGKILYEELMDAENIIEVGEINGEKFIIVGNKTIDQSGSENINLKDFVYKIK
jgi:hypothetical protein